MILTIDVGGTKTLCTLFDNQDNTVDTVKFPTNQNYEDFIKELSEALRSFRLDNVSICVVGAPGIINRKADLMVVFGNLGWHNIKLRKDVENIVKKPTFIENDAKIAGLYEAVTLGKKYKRVLYITISTGIGFGLTVNGKIDLSVSDAGGKGMFFEHKGILQPWEDYASGKAIFNEFGKRASDIDDKKTWEDIVSRWVEGFIDLINLTTPDIICIGGGVGSHFDKYKVELERQLSPYRSDFVEIPPIVQATNAEEAVVYGCLEYAKQKQN